MVDCCSSEYILAFLPKALVNNMASGRSSGSTLYSAFPLAQWFVLKRVSICRRMVFTATGIAPG
jgi:hypothetical protein